LAEIKVSGVYQLQQRMKALSNAVATRGAKKAVRAGAQKIADAAIELAKKIDDPKTPNNIAANIAVQFASRGTAASGNVRYRVGVLGGAAGRERISKFKRDLTGKGLPGGETWYWRFHEFGTSKMAARPFMRPAAANRAEVAAEEIATVLEQFLDHTVREVASVQLRGTKT